MGDVPVLTGSLLIIKSSCSEPNECEFDINISVSQEEAHAFFSWVDYFEFNLKNHSKVISMILQIFQDAMPNHKSQVTPTSQTFW